MGVKILLQHAGPERVTPTEDVKRTPEDKQLWTEGGMKLAKKVGRPDTVFERWHVEKFGGSTGFNYPVTVNVGPVVASFIKAEKAGFDAVIPTLYIDTGLQEARGALQIPVIGPSEASMMVAQLVGRRFAIVTVREQLIHTIEKNLRQYGWEDRAIKNRPVRAFSPWYFDACREAWKGKPEKLIADFEKVALECIKDGADAIIMGCYPAGAALSLNNYTQIGNTGVPFVCPACSSIKMAEMMADFHKNLGLKKTEVLGGPYQTPPKAMIDQMFKEFGF